MNRYLKLYGWIWEVFGNERFTLSKFRITFPGTQHKKTIHDLIRLEYVKRLSRGEYKAIEPNEFIRHIVQESLSQKDVLEKAKMKYAFCCNDAVSIWTEGYYWTGFTKGFKPVHIMVLRRDSDKWRKFFRENRAEYIIEGENKTLFGLVYILHCEEDFGVEIKDNMPVVPLKETVRFCSDNELTYRPALEYLDNRYRLNILDRYEHINT